jgi:carboxypeptidase Taq
MSYAALAHRYRRIAHFQHVEAIVSWDEAAMMPAGGGEARAEALASLRVLLHELQTEPGLGDLFATADAEGARGGLGDWEAANLREMKRGYLRDTALPAELVKRSSLAESRCEQAWRQLRPRNDWAGMLPLLEEVVAAKRAAAQALGERLRLDPYDALLDGFEPGARRAAIDPLFAELRSFLPTFIAAAVQSQRHQSVLEPAGPFPIERQRWLGLEIARRVGFDFQHGRLDVSHHPFCGGVPRDVRITTRYDEADFASSLMAVLHETGHGKYEQNLPATWLDQPVGRARSMALHESQSLFQEMQISRGRDFLECIAPLVRAAFPEAVARAPEAFTAGNLHLHYTRVRPGFIRVDADEVTYPCHILLRYDLERQLIAGSLLLRDLPDAWDAGMRALLGLATGNDHRNGCLQDVHWPAGLFGYFPTYTLGALVAAQLYAAARRALPELPGQLRAGELAPLNGWLREAVWSRGCLLETGELVEAATGSPIGTQAFIAHLQQRYG